MPFVISEKIRAKLLEKHGVSNEEVLECFTNRESGFLIDTREDHLTDPPTQWFIAETNYGRRLKVCFVFKQGNVYIKTAYSPNAREESIYSTNS